MNKEEKITITADEHAEAAARVFKEIAENEKINEGPGKMFFLMQIPLIAAKIWNMLMRMQESKDDMSEVRDEDRMGG